jgi:hypothetical protein
MAWEAEVGSYNIQPHNSDDTMQSDLVGCDSRRTSSGSGLGATTTMRVAKTVVPLPKIWRPKKWEEERASIPTASV